MTQQLIQTDLCTKGTFVVFHESKYLETADYDRANVRRQCFNNITAQLSQHFEPLNTPTVSLRTKKEASEWLKENPLFHLDPDGWRGKVFFNTITGLHEYEYDPQAQPEGWTAPLIGIWASNYLAWKNFLKTDADYLILIEDDLVITDKFSETIKENVAQLPENWDVFYQYAPAAIPNKQKFKPVGLPNVCRPWQTWSNAAYLLSRKGAQKIVDEIEGGYEIHFPADWIFLCRDHDYEMYNMKPWIDMECRLAQIQSTHDSVSQRFWFSDYLPENYELMVNTSLLPEI